MLHTEFPCNRSTGSGEEDFQRVFTIYNIHVYNMGMAVILVM